MYKMNSEVIDFLRKLTLSSPNLVVKGGSSLLIRNFALSIDDYRSSMDIDLTVIGPSKNRGPSSQYDPNKNRLDNMLEELGISYDYMLANPRRAIYTIEIGGQKIELESSVPNHNEYEEYDIVAGIKVAKLEKVIADKILIMIEYNSDGNELINRYIRHCVDFMKIEEWYDYDLLKNKDKIIKEMELRMKNNASKYNLLYSEINRGWMDFVKGVLLVNGNFNEINKFIESEFETDNVKNVVTKSKVDKISKIIKELRYEKIRI